MNDKIVEFIAALETNNYDDFVSNTSINSSISLAPFIDDYDYSWLNEVEEKVPFINNIINYASNNIVIKNYENRFIKTLIYRLYDFILMEQKSFDSIDIENGIKTMETSVKTITDSEIIDIELKVKCQQNGEVKKGESYGLTLKERIQRVNDIVLNLLDTSFMKILSEEPLVHSPIEKSIVFEEDLNYKKALELFEYMESYDSKTKNSYSDESKSLLDEKLLITSYLEYQLLKDCNKDISKDNVYKLFLEKIVEKMVEDTSIDEKTFKKMITKKFDDAYKKKKNREKSIQNIFIKNIDNYNKQVKDALRILKS